MINRMTRDDDPQDEAPRGGSYYLITGAVIGLIIGLILALAFFPLRWTDAVPRMLDEDSQNDYVVAIALAYYAEKDLGRAEARLAELEIDMNIPNYLNGLGATIRTEDGGPSLRMYAVQKLAHDLSDGVITIEGLDEFFEEEDTPTQEDQPTEEPESAVPETPTQQPAAQQPTSTSPAAAETDEDSDETETEEAAQVETPPEPTPAAIAASNQPFQLAERLNFCDQNLSQQLQVQVMDADGVPLQGVSIFIQWDGGSETFFTGLYPEIDDGYADYAMTQELTYQLQVGETSLFIEDIRTETCELDDGTTYQGGVWLLFEPQS